ncbi:MAG TPA: alpha/beta fold hydrolase [Telluria sp.]
MKKITCGITLCLAVLGPAPAWAQAVREIAWIPMNDQGAFGPREIRLEASLYRPAGPGPHPVVVFNHGASGGPIPDMYTETAQVLAGFLNARGIALLAPMRRGRGNSQGVNKEEPSPCTVEGAQRGISYATGAVDAAFAWLRTQSWADMNKVVLAGHSRGGLLGLAYAAQYPRLVRGVVNFSGGWKNDTCGEADINLALFDAAGQKAQVPALFLYARGDGFYADASMQKYAQVFNAAGGSADFRLYEMKEANGHLLFKRGLPLWERDLGKFLEELGVRGSPALKSASR